MYQIKKRKRQKMDWCTDCLILTACQHDRGYFMSWNRGIAYILCLYLYFWEVSLEIFWGGGINYLISSIPIK